MNDKNDVIVKTIENLKKSQFGVTAIKVELEAQLNRGRSDHCGDCHDGMRYCDYCEEGRSECSECYGSGEVEGDEGQENCGDCDGEGYYNCSDCDGEWRWECGDCDGGDDNFSDERQCHDFILERLVPLGLAEEIGDEDYSYARKYKPKLPLVFSKFYNDGSVDSEHTFTLSIENPETVLLLPKFLEIFNELADAVGGDVETEGAGMHIALLQTEAGIYPDRDWTPQSGHMRNFRRSMNLLLPALYFLSSPNDISRSLSYRRPRIEIEGTDGSKYFAINYGRGALEFRIFETCYANPEMILDNLVVIGNAMRYWRASYLNPGLDKIATSVRFGKDDSNDLSRFYQKVEHLELLNEGLKRLKPSYLSVKEVKAQRNFKTSKMTLKKRDEKLSDDAKLEYKEYSNRFDWRLVMLKHDYIRRLASDNSSRETSTPPEQAMAEIEAKAEEHSKKSEDERLTVDAYVQRRLKELNERMSGEYTLTVEF